MTLARAVWLLAPLTLLTPEASAQRDHAVGVFFDAGATARWHRAAPLTSFDAFVITFNLDLPAKRSEVLGGFEVAVEVDARLIVLDRSPLPYAATEITDHDGLADDNWIIESSQCLPGHGTIRLVRYVALLATAANDVIFCLQPAQGGQDHHLRPAWLDCAGARHPLTYVRDLTPSLTTGCGVVNPLQTVSALAATWTALKSRFASRPPE